jgi:hypothetical protein
MDIPSFAVKTPAKEMLLAKRLFFSATGCDDAAQPLFDAQPRVARQSSPETGLDKTSHDEYQRE